MVIKVLPKLPAWVSQQGLALSVKVAFTVLPDGVVGGAAIEKTSGYADVDASVIAAIRKCVFNPVPGSAPAKGTIPYTVKLR
jgi:TonB family protein